MLKSHGKGDGAKGAAAGGEKTVKVSFANYGSPIAPCCIQLHDHNASIHIHKVYGCKCMKP